ncbi:MAG: heme NO-binding domain-containing protein, partial [Proteobacteria bacterium]|nr:heme NO-binding domain-containing protein [Pseudomonadota bacterium]
MEEMTATVLEVAQNASQSSEAAATASTAANDGVRLVRESVTGINQVADSSRKLAQVLGQLDSQAAEIDRIINVINDIADQTNLLALNAAIEAARAGDAGRGFAVVADEVRKLAEKTMTATKEVENSIREIQGRSQHAVTTMRETERQVELSTDLSNRTGQALEEIMRRIDDVTARVAQIATAAEEQSAAAEEINRNIEDIAGIASETEEGAGQAASATRDLAELSQNLLQMSMTFTATKADASKLRASRGEMKGILPKIMLEFAKVKYGEKVYEKVSAELGNPVFLPAQSYPDQVLGQMADILARESGKDARAVFLELGKYTIGQFHKMYKPYFKAKTLKEFYLTMNDTHAALTKAHPGIVPPRFSYEDRGEKLTMIYKSRRGYHHYFEGILTGAAEFFKTPVGIKVQVLDPETARAEIMFR